MTTPDERDNQGPFTTIDLVNLSDDAKSTFPCYPGTPPPNPDDPPASLERMRAASPERSPKKPRRAAPARRDAGRPASRGGQPAVAGSPGRHERLCGICNHPDREAIEFDFLHWRNPEDISCEHHIRDRSSIYRHAHATGLFALRRRNSRAVLERLVERVDEVSVTDIGILRALREYSRLNDDGQWPPEDNDAPQEDSRVPKEGTAETPDDLLLEAPRTERPALPPAPSRALPPAQPRERAESTPSLIGAPPARRKRPGPRRSLTPPASPVPSATLLEAPKTDLSEVARGAEGSAAEGSTVEGPAKERS